MTIDKLLECAANLIDPPEDCPPEYARGICELLARAYPREGYSTDERAVEFANRLRVVIYRGVD